MNFFKCEQPQNSCPAAHPSKNFDGNRKNFNRMNFICKELFLTCASSVSHLWGLPHCFKTISPLFFSTMYVSATPLCFDPCENIGLMCKVLSLK